VNSTNDGLTDGKNLSKKKKEIINGSGKAVIQLEYKKKEELVQATAKGNSGIKEKVYRKVSTERSSKYQEKKIS
jgi:hypothetical protein